MACPVCSGSMESCFIAQVLGKYPAHYEVCKNCGFLRAQEPHWLDEAYSCAIAAADTGLVMRNIALACKLAGALCQKDPIRRGDPHTPDDVRQVAKSE